MPNMTRAIGDVTWDSEGQSRYLVSGHGFTWPEGWHRLPPWDTTDHLLEDQVQDALSYAHVVGNTRKLDWFMDTIYALLGVHKPTNMPEELNVTPETQWEMSDDFRKTLSRATQVDRVVYNAWFGGNTRPRPYKELCRANPYTAS